MYSKLLSPITRQPIWMTGLVFSVIAVIGIVFLTSQQVGKILEKDDKTFRHRADLLNAYIQSCTKIVDSMASTVKAGYINESKQQSNPVAIEYLRDYPQHDSFGISGFTHEGGNEKLNSTLTGEGSLARITPTLRNEIVAALLIDSQIGTHTSSTASQFLWAYYTSISRFVILAPKVAVDDFQFTTDLYTKAYWTHAIPSANPDLKTIISPLYEDAGGKGYMITVSAPVVSSSIFLGVASIDLGIETLSHLLSFDTSLGESLLVRNNGNVIARPNSTVLHEHVNQERIDSEILENDSHWYLSQPISNHDIVMMHQINKRTVYLQAFYQSAPWWIALLLTLGLIFTLIKLKQAFSNLKEVAYVDQLSTLLNRRGFRNNIEQVLATYTRIKTPWVILMLDIDLFKKVNDGFGHETGDKIIISISNILRNNIRSSDLVCRWGGEEFVIFLYNTTIQDGEKLAQKYRHEISSTIRTPALEPITVSIGIAQASSGESLDEVIERSDRCLYFAKHTGRNKVSTKSSF